MALVFGEEMQESLIMLGWVKANMPRAQYGEIDTNALGGRLPGTLGV